MDAVHIGSEAVRDGLDQMLRAVLGEHSYLDGPWVDVSIALLICAIAQRVPDSTLWFPRGQSATIQAIETRVDQEVGRQIKAIADPPGGESQ